MDAYVGEIRIFAGSFAPEGWLLCDGSTVNVQQYQALYGVIGNIYGGTAPTTFKLPDLIGKASMSQGQGTGLTARTVGSSFGETKVTLLSNQLAAHTHAAQAVDSPGNDTSTNNAVWAQSPLPSRGSQTPLYQNAAPDTPLAPTSVAPIGGNQAHNNIQPYLAIYHIICYEGEFPIRP